MKALKDYIHFYLRQECQTPTRVYNDEIPGKPYKLRGQILDIDLVIDQAGVHLPGNPITDLNNYAFSELKLILRPLSSITIEEAKEVNIEMGQILLAQIPKDAGLKFFTANQFQWFLSKGFDLFGLIEEGLAIKKGDELKQL